MRGKKLERLVGTKEVWVDKLKRRVDKTKIVDKKLYRADKEKRIKKRLTLDKWAAVDKRAN